MSEIIKSVFVNYILCAALGGILEYLTPERFRKALRVAVVSLMVFSVVSPFLGNDIVLDALPFEEAQDITRSNSLEGLASLTQKSIYSEIQQILINHQINEYEIDVEVNYSEEENTVYLDSIKINVDNNDKIEAILADIPKEYKSVTEIGAKNE